MSRGAKQPEQLELHALCEAEQVRVVGTTWHIAANRAKLTGQCDLPAGWYQLQLHFVIPEVAQKHQKRIEFAWSADAEQAVSPVRDSLNWDTRLKQSILVELPYGAKQFTMTLHNSPGEILVKKFRLKRIPPKLLQAKALVEKVRLLLNYNCFWPVLRRGCAALLRGDTATLRAKLQKGLRDSRTMRPGANLSQETAASWTRRRALPAEHLAAIRARVEAMPRTVPISVVLLVDCQQIAATRLALESLRQQLYPFWEVLIVGCGAGKYYPLLQEFVANLPSAKLVYQDEADGMTLALAQAMQQIQHDWLLLLPNGWELREDALFHFAQAVTDNPLAQIVSAPVYSLSGQEGAASGTLVLCQTRCLSDQPPEEFTLATVQEWVLRSCDNPVSQNLPEVAAYPLTGAAILELGKIGTLPLRHTAGKALVLAADVRGLSGWDAVSAVAIRGLASLGYACERHPLSVVRSELLPPSVQLPVANTLRGAKQLVIRPPFLVPSFEPTRDTAVLTMWETDRLKPQEVKALNRAGLVIVPSTWQVETFRASGVTVPLEVVPLGYDPLLYHDDGSWPKQCTFGTAGALEAGGIRKNTQRIIELFREAFPTQSDVRLLVKISPKSSPVETFDDPRIEVLQDQLTLPQLAAWYRSLTVYVNGSFGEGFGLHLIEAMACGRAIISAEATGLTSFFDAQVGYAVPCQKVPVENDIYTGHWMVPDEQAIVAAMRTIYNLPNDARQRGARSATRAKRFTWKHFGRSLVKALAKHGFFATEQRLVEVGR